VKVAFEVPVEEGPKIRYPMAIVKEAKAPQAAKKFFGYLSSDEAGRVFQEVWFYRDRVSEKTMSREEWQFVEFTRSNGSAEHAAIVAIRVGAGMVAGASCNGAEKSLLRR